MSAWLLLLALCIAPLALFVPAVGLASLIAALLLITGISLAYGRSNDRAVRRSARARLAVLQAEAKEIANAKKALLKQVRAAEEAASAAFARAQKQVDLAKSGEHAELLASDQALQRAVSAIGPRQQRALTSRNTELGNALRQAQQQHITQYLRRFPVRSAGLPGVGPALIRTLEAHGVRTAADFVAVQTGSSDTYMRLTNGNSYKIPGLGPKKGYTLHAWRVSLQSAALAKQPTALQPAEAQRITAKYDSELQSLANEERAAKGAAAQRRNEVQKRWVATHAAAARALAESQRVAASARAALGASLLQVDRRKTDVDWRRTHAEREFGATSGLKFRGYFATSLRGQ